MDKIKFLLESTGLTPDELILKLSEYKFITNNNANSIDDTNIGNEEEEGLPSNEIIEDIKEEDIKQEDIKDEVIEIFDDEDECSNTSNSTKHVESTNQPNFGQDIEIDNSAQTLPKPELLYNNIMVKNEDDPKIGSFIIKNEEDIEKRTPIYGSLRKRVPSQGSSRKIIRSSKNPNLEQQKSASSSDEESENDNVEIPKGYDISSEISMQLLQLRSKRPKNDCYLSENTKIENSYNSIKIVDIRGGVKETQDTILDKSPRNEDEFCNKNSDTNKLKDEKIFSYRVINEELDCTPIRLTKTNDYRNIKGWKRKKLLVNSIYDDETYKEFMEINEICKSEPECSNIKLYKGDESIENKLGIQKAYLSNAIPDVKIAKELTIELTENEFDDSNGVSGVFLGSSLDGFFNNEENLNFSSNVPKVLTEVHNTDSKFDSHEVVEYCNSNVEETPKIFVKNDDPNRPRTLADKRKLLENFKFEPKSKISKIGKVEKVLPSDACYSYVNWSGRKLRIPTKYKKDVDANYNHKMNPPYDRKARSLIRGKPSIYAVPKASKVEYRAGPLCKKPAIQFNDVNKWETVIKNLPKITLNVYPSFNSPIDPIAKKFVKFDSWEIDNNRAEFAMSALYESGFDSTKKNKFTFDVPYGHNQTQILLRKENKIVSGELETITPINSTETEEERTSQIESILFDVITAVEIKEIEKSLIKDDPESLDRNEIPLMEFETDKKSGKKQKKKDFFVKGKRMLRHLELKRLNVKIIELDVDEEDDPNKECGKEHCQYGCVCKSVAGNSFSYYDHCENVNCMFGCVCGYDNSKSQVYKLSVPSGIDLLSDRTVNRLQSVVTKDLARVEKQFTQTIIHSNNQTIVVGDNMNRKRRASRCPNKYKDYVDVDNDNTFNPEIENDSNDDGISFKVVDNSIAKRKAIDNFVDKNCQILLPKLDLNHVYPYCLEHNLYQCHCNFNSHLTKKKHVQIKKQPTTEVIEPTKKSTRKRKFTEIAKASYFATELEKEENISCARIQPVSSDVFKIRNKEIEFKKKLVKRLKLDFTLVEDWINSTDETVMKPVDTIPLLTPENIEFKELEDSKSNRRKQKLEVRDDASPLKVITTPQKLENQDDGEKPTLSAEELSFTPPDAFMEKLFNEILGKTYIGDAPSISPYRMLPWNFLIDCYVNNQLTIWCNNCTSKPKFILSNNDIENVPGYKNIKEYEKFESHENIQVDLIRWVITQKLPGEDTNSDNMYVIIKKKSGYTFFEICGVCTKKNFSKSGNHVMPPSEVDDIIDIDKLEETTLDKERDNKPKERYIKAKERNINGKERDIMVKERDMNPKERGMKPKERYIKPKERNNMHDEVDKASMHDILNLKPVDEVVFANNKFSTKFLAPLEYNANNLKRKADSILCAGLPNTGSGCKWRMLPLISDFDLLLLSLNSFCIKFMDLGTIMNVAIKHQKTIIINTEEVTFNYLHKLFGIYVVPQYKDRVFIGPYYKHEVHNFKTVHTRNVGKGERAYKYNSNNGIWIHQLEISPDDSPAKVIDLTDQEEVKKNKFEIVSLLKKYNNNDNRKDSISPCPTKEVFTQKIVQNGIQNGIGTKKLNGFPKSLLKRRPNLEIIPNPANENQFQEVLRIPDPKNAIHPLHPLLIEGLKTTRLVTSNEGAVQIVFKFAFMDEVVYGCSNADQKVYLLWPESLNPGFGIKFFYNLGVAVDWLKMEMSNCFIKMPPSFIIDVDVLIDEPSSYKIFRKEYVVDCYIIGDFGMIKLIDVILHTKKYENRIDEFNVRELKLNSSFCKRKFAKLLSTFVKSDEHGDSLLVYQLKNKILAEKMRSSKYAKNKGDMRKKLLMNYFLLLSNVSKQEPPKQDTSKSTQFRLKENEVITVESESDEEEPIGDAASENISIAGTTAQEKVSKDSLILESVQQNAKEQKKMSSPIEINDDKSKVNNFRHFKIVNNGIINVDFPTKVVPLPSYPIKPANSFTLLSESFNPETSTSAHNEDAEDNNHSEVKTIPSPSEVKKISSPKNVSFPSHINPSKQDSDKTDNDNVSSEDKKISIVKTVVFPKILIPADKIPLNQNVDKINLPSDGINKSMGGLSTMLIPAEKLDKNKLVLSTKNLHINNKLIPVQSFPIKASSSFKLLEKNNTPSTTPIPSKENGDKIVKDIVPCEVKNITIPNKDIQKVDFSQLSKKVVLKFYKNKDCSHSVKLLPSEAQHFKVVTPNKTCVQNQKVTNNDD